MLILCYNLMYFEKKYFYEVFRIFTEALQILVYFFENTGVCYQKKQYVCLMHKGGCFPPLSRGGGAVG